MTKSSTGTLVPQAAIEAYRRDGAAFIKGVIPHRWIDDLRVAIEEELTNPTATSVEYTPKGKEGRYYGDFFVWRHNTKFRELALLSPAARIAREVMQSARVNFFYDQLLVKEKGTSEPTPLHQDLPYWPIRGNQIVSLWLPFDEVNAQSGAVHYIRGSHKWNKMFAPRAFSDDSGFGETYKAMHLEPIDAVEQRLDTYQHLVWNTQPGDVIVHHPLTVHWAPGNTSTTTRRRAIALRYVGDDAVYDDRPGTFMKNFKLASHLPKMTLRDGMPLSGDLFPEIHF